MTRRAYVWGATFALGLTVGWGSARADRVDGQSLKDAPVAFFGDPRVGWDLFRDKNCASCHAVWGQGGDVGPDLGRTRTLGHVTAGQLAGVMWNHVPRMWEKMEQGGIELIDISPQEMGDLFAFLLFTRYADEPGDPIEGQRVLRARKCDVCHSLGRGGGRGPDLLKWTAFINPVVWAQKMWGHASGMRDLMRAEGIRWPEFSGQDLVNVVAYIRSGTAGEGKVYLKPGSPERGMQLFDARGCDGCHRLGEGGGVGPDLATVDLPETLAGIASAMWNHAPAMLREIARRGEKGATELEAQEMADIIAYILTRRYYANAGDAEIGQRVFVAKRCASCHALGDYSADVAPDLSPIRGRASAVLMAHVMWRYGPPMLDLMADRGIPWPHFEGNEMADLIAFMNRRSGAE